MKKFRITLGLKSKLIIEIILSFIFTLIFIYCVSIYILGPYFEENQVNFNETMAVVFAIAYIVSGIGVFVTCFLVLANKHVRYIKYIANEVKLIADGNLDATLKIKGKDELADLCTNINSMSKELNEKFEHERDLERTKTELITNVSHDLRTPLTPIIAYLDILNNKKYTTEEEKEEYLNSSYFLSLKLKKLIDELFEFTKLSDNEINVDFRVVDICRILRQIVGEYSPFFESMDLSVITQIPETEILVKIDIEKMIRVFENILNNAEKYSIKPSDIIVKAEVIEKDVIVSIANRGEHIEPEKLCRMFDKFYRGDTSRSSSI